MTYDDVRQQLDWLCDAMIPGDPELGFPSARDVGVQETLLPMALKTRSDLAPAVLSIVAGFPRERPDDPLALVAALSPDDRALLGRFVAGAYLASQAVMAQLGYPGFQALHIEPDYDEIMEAVEPIIARGPCYRPV
ncbi:hypothetical protein [Rhizobium sp. 2MFCol3.1]|uniref:hypothetical protein n=1 Tax=Rhizobium sp. 2MFCol3.1 TaxID=1246459 RepID=UPI0003754310|nr:hypothetical protein [Rhizobium sp. 2MFCol3.1]